MRTSASPCALAVAALLLAACEPAPGGDTVGQETAGSATAALSLATGASAAAHVAAPGVTEPATEPAAADSAGTNAQPDAAPGTAEPSSHAAGDDELVARVNGEPILLAEFQRQAFDTQRYFVDQGLDPNTEKGQRQLLALRRQVLEDMINQVLIEQADEDLGLTVSEAEIDDSLRMQIEDKGGPEAFEQALSDAGTTMEQVREMERSALLGLKVLDLVAADVPETAEFVRARHILCESRSACDDALARLRAGEPFDAVAKDVSIDTVSAERGGDLDWVARGMLPSQQVEDAIFALAPGDRTGVVETDFGFHIIEVIERDDEHPLSDAQRYQLKEKRLLEWLAERRSAATIQIYVADLRPPSDTQ